MTTSGQLFNYMQPVMNTMVDMMGLYHNYSNIVELLLEIYCEAAKRMLCYLTTSASRHLYQQTINLIQVYAINNQVSLPTYGFFSIGESLEKNSAFLQRLSVGNF